MIHIKRGINPKAEPCIIIMEWSVIQIPKVRFEVLSNLVAVQHMLVTKYFSTKP